MPPALLSAWMLALLGGDPPPAGGADRGPLSATAEGWSIARTIVLPPGMVPAPSALAAAVDGTLYLGVHPPEGVQDATPSSGSVIALKAGSPSQYAVELGRISGLESIDGTLFVLQGGSLSALADRDRDGRADQRIELVRGLGTHPAARSRAEPVASGLRLGIDGLLYFTVDDRGVLNAAGKDGKAVRLRGGGVLRVRPDGSGLEAVSTGERRPRSLALDASGEIFTLGEPDPSGRWPGGLTHHIDGGHYGYPYQFLTAPGRALPVMGGGIHGDRGQLVLHEEDATAPGEQSGLIVCDPSARQVLRLELRRAGGSFAILRKTVIVRHGGLDDFRPVALGVDPREGGIWVADEASPRQRSGRVFYLVRSGRGRRPAPEEEPDDRMRPLSALNHPRMAMRIQAQRALSRQGEPAIAELVRRFQDPAGELGRIHALWALDEIGTEPAREAVRRGLRDPSARLRLQAARSCGLRADRAAVGVLCDLLDDRDPFVRRESAIALGRIGERSALGRLMDHLGEGDRLAGWSIRTAIRRLGYPEQNDMERALADSRRREAALLLAEEAWSVPVARALVRALAGTTEPAVRGRIVAALGGQFGTYPEWEGDWWGPNPLAGPFPRKTRPWHPEGRAVVLQGMRLGMSDREASVRYQAIFALAQFGPAAVPMLVEGLNSETEAANQEAIVEGLGAIADPKALGVLVALLGDASRPESLRGAALDALASHRGPEVLRARLGLLYDPAAPGGLVARALPPLARAGILPPNDLVTFLEHPSPLVRAAAVLSVNVKRAPPELHARVLASLGDASEEVRQAAVLAVGALGIREAIPRLIEIAGKPGDPLRPQAISSLCQMPDPRAIEVYQAAARGEDPSLRRIASQALEALGAPRDAAVVQAERARVHPNPQIEEFRRFVLTHQGDARKGEELFREPKPSGCGRCHSTGEPAPSQKPDPLAQKRSRSEWVDALLKPSRPVAAAHRQVGRIESVLSPLDLTDLVSYLEMNSAAVTSNTSGQMGGIPVDSR